MPKCKRCGKEQPILKSLDTPEGRATLVGEALCDECFDKASKELGRK